MSNAMVELENFVFNHKSSPTETAIFSIPFMLIRFLLAVTAIATSSLIGSIQHSFNFVHVLPMTFAPSTYECVFASKVNKNSL